MHLALESNSTSHNSRWEQLFGGLGAEPPAGGKRGFGGGTPYAETIFYSFFPKTTYF